MEYHYDHEVDILTIRIREGVFADGDEEAPGLVAAYDEEGNLLELELRNVNHITVADFERKNIPPI